MRILILGGTAFLSAATARHARERGHHVSCLARGTTARPPAGTSWVRADRDNGPEAYQEVSGTEQQWDAVIDVAMQPIQVRQALDALAGRVGHWTFVSTLSVYADESVPGQDESAELHPPLESDRFTELNDYGPAKVACEEAIRAAVGERAHILSRRSDRRTRGPQRPGRLLAGQIRP
jgi:nucleoside-diphosphate-sugar epimerase